MSDSDQVNIQEEVKANNDQQRLIKIKSIDGSVLEIRVDPNITVAEFRKVIQQHTQVAPELQRLIYKAKLLADEQPLSTYIKEDGETIHMVKRPAPEPGQQQSQPNIPPGQQSQPGQQQQQQQQPNMNANPFESLINNLMGNVGNLFGGMPQGQPQGTHVHHHHPPHGQGAPIGVTIQTSVTNPNQNQPFNFQQIPNMMGPNPNMRQFIVRPPGAGQPMPMPFPFPFGQPPVQGNIHVHQHHSHPPQQQPPQAQDQQQLLAQQQQQQQRGPQVIQLPHQNVFQIGSICNQMMGRDAQFPGPMMPQLPFDRNMCVLLGSYLNNLSQNLQRLLPFMQRCGDLLQRESLLQNPRDRTLTQDLAHQVGRALEEVARSSASVAHFYREINLGENPGAFTVQTEGYNRDFQAILQQAGTVQRIPPHQQPHQMSQVRPQLNPQQQQDLINNQFIDQIRNLQGNINQYQSQAQQQTQQQDQTQSFAPQQQQQEPSAQTQQQTQSQQDPISSFIQMANPLLNNVLNNMNLDQPIINYMDESAEEQPESMFLQLTSQLSLQEMLAIMQSNFGALQGMYRKLKNVLIKNMNNQDTPENRKALAEKEGAKLKTFITIPTEVYDNIHEGFDPLIVTGEIVDTHFIKIINAILDFDDHNKTDADFIDEMKDHFADLIGEWIEELQDGFVNGLSDVVVFLRSNFRVMLEVGGGPEMGGMISSMGIEPVMNYVTMGHRRYKENKERRASQPREDVKMQEVDEEEKVETQEQKRERFLQNYQSIISKDQEIIQNQDEQNPLSRAYLSLCPVNKSQNIQVEEEKQTQETSNYLIDRTSKGKTPAEYLRAQIRRTLIEFGYPSAKVDEVLSDVKEMPETLVQSYFNMLKQDIKERLADDEDYQDLKIRGDSHIQELNKL
eukprot:403338593